MDRHRRLASLFTQQFSTRFPTTSLDSQSHSICTHMVRIAWAACVGARVFTGQWFSGNQPACFPFFLIIPRQVCMVQHLHIVHNTCCLTILSSILESKLFTRLDTCTTEWQRSGEIAHKKSIGWGQKQKVIRNWDRACNVCFLRAVYKDVLQCSCQDGLKV